MCAHGSNDAIIRQELLEGTHADKWIEEKDSVDLELDAFFRLDKLSED